MANHSSLPIQFTINNQNWRLQINNGINQTIELSSHLLGGQRNQNNQNPTSNERLRTGNNSGNPDVSLEMHPSDNVEDVITASNSETDHQNRQTSSIMAINQLLEQNPELNSIVKTFLTYLPFLALLLFKEIYKHTSDILVMIALVITFIHGNRTLQQEVSKQAKRELGPLCIIITNILACILLVYYLCGGKELYHSLLVFSDEPSSITIAYLIWTVVVNDHVLKLLTVLIKTLIASIPIGLFPPSRRGKWFVFAERSSQLYRALAVVPPWIHYLNSSSGSQDSTYFISSSVVGIGLCAIYFTCKVYKTVKLILKWKLAFMKLLQSTNYGSSPSAENLQAAGPMCPICHDSYRKPTLLPCKHIFCEHCLAVWLDRERTCPMCRSTIAENPKWKDGSTTFLVQLF